MTNQVAKDIKLSNRSLILEGSMLRVLTIKETIPVTDLRRGLQLAIQIKLIILVRQPYNWKQIMWDLFHFLQVMVAYVKDVMQGP